MCESQKDVTLSLRGLVDRSDGGKRRLKAVEEE